MGSEWREVTVEQACTLVVDCPHSTPVWTDSGVVVIRNTYLKNGRMDLANPSYTDEEHYQDRVRRATPQPRDLVISREAPIGEIAMIPEGLRACLGQRVVLLRPNEAICDGRFLLYSFIGGELRDEIMSHEGTGLDCTQEGGQGVKSYLGLMILGRKLSRGHIPQTGVQPPFVV